MQLEVGDGHLWRDVPLLRVAQGHAVQRLSRQRAVLRRGWSSAPDDLVQARHRCHALVTRGAVGHHRCRSARVLDFPERDSVAV